MDNGGRVKGLLRSRETLNWIRAHSTDDQNMLFKTNPEVFASAYHSVSNLRASVVADGLNSNAIQEYKAAYEILIIIIMRQLGRLTRCPCADSYCTCPEPNNVDDLSSLVRERLEKHFALSEKRYEHPLAAVLKICRDVRVDELKKFLRMKRGSGTGVSSIDNENSMESINESSYLQWKRNSFPSFESAVKEIPRFLETLTKQGKLSSEKAEIYLKYHIDGEKLNELASRYRMNQSTICRWNQETTDLLRKELN